MFIKKIFSFLPINFIFFIIILLSFIPIITIYYVIKFYLFAVKINIHQLKQGIVVQLYSTFNHEATQSCGIYLILG
ncbi:hypothetical protein RS022_05380 [Candidatus Phytoplasma rubi]|uniref:Uncharacterized protein n=1 Tax=Candidatus Phytoplasma rubi TaxID=399025 RepID=A0ABY7BSQ1_9MOLU|nr:hypothetical protein [Candidatus Phytoplasma rubi]WAN63408.1 hypothetical protein RS022_05380 [Candidatus Phytoplasma rubi]